MENEAGSLVERLRPHIIVRRLEAHRAEPPLARPCRRKLDRLTAETAAAKGLIHEQLVQQREPAAKLDADAESDDQVSGVLPVRLNHPDAAELGIAQQPFASAAGAVQIVRQGVAGVQAGHERKDAAGLTACKRKESSGHDLIIALARGGAEAQLVSR